MYGACLFLIYLFGAFNIVLSKEIDLSCKEIENIMDYHNVQREKVAAGNVKGHPAASLMNYMVWDPELQKKAKSWSAQGEFKHNPDRTINSGRFKVGENIYYSTSTDPNYKFDTYAAMKAWFDEYKNFKYRALSQKDFNNNNKQIGHYTQMVWSDTSRVGCGLSKTPHGSYTSYLFVCNYGPAGNTYGQVPYPSSDYGTTLTCKQGDDCDSPYGKSCPN